VKLLHLGGAAAGDKASCSVITRVPSLRTTVTDLGTWLPVRRCSKAIAAWAICCAMVDFDLFMGLVPPGCDRPAPPNKKADVAEHPQVFDHVGLLVNGLPGPAELPFT
jgi:hypothetical protein